MRIAFTSLVVVAATCACQPGHLKPGPDDNTPAPIELQPIGTAASLDIGAWNLKNFPCGNESTSTTCRPGSDKTPALDAQLMAKLDPDLLAVEEIDDETAFDDVVAAMPHRTGILSSHEYFDGTYQKVGFIYDADTLVAAADPVLLFEHDDAFPRPALAVPFTWKGAGGALSFVAIAVHLKAGETDDDKQRRKQAIEELETAVAAIEGGTEAQLPQADDVVVLGDWNESLTKNAPNFAPFATASFDIRTQTLATAGDVSFLPSSSLIDHIVTTSAFSAAGTHAAVIPRVDESVQDYLDTVSDHLPVFVSLEAP